MPNIEIVGFGDEWAEQRETALLPSQDSKYTLKDLSEEWHFFTHGALFTFAEFDYPREDPVADWFAQQIYKVQVLRQPFKRAVFDGLTAPCVGGLTWNHIICAVRKEHWQSLFEFVGGICAMNQKEKTLYSSFAGDLKIMDPGWIEAHSILDPRVPLVTVTVFCVESNKDRWEIRPPTSLIAPPRFVRINPRPEIISMSEALFKGDTSKLFNRANPAFQAHLDKYQEILRNGPKIIQ